jgi:sugar lactone lactonase YvrE
MQPEIINDAKATLGEGPAWDAQTGTLFWLDILEKKIHFHRQGEDGFIQLEGMPGCLAPSKEGKLVVALSETTNERSHVGKFVLFDRAGDGLAPVKVTVLASVNEPADNRFNDGKCDPAGRFLAGSMNMDEETPSGALYSFDGSQVTRLLDGVRISNGLAWSSDYKTYYYIDTPTRQVKAFDYDLATGELANLRVVIAVPEVLGWPDGMTSDTSGNLWIAMWGGASVTRWNPQNGNLLEQIDLPAKNVTSCVFGGAGLNELFITSACKGLGDADLTAYRHSGSLMRLETRVEGMPTFEFG